MRQGSIGAGEGKGGADLRDAVIKQLLLLHGEGFSDSERNSYREVMYAFLLESRNAASNQLIPPIPQLREHGPISLRHPRRSPSS